MFRLRTTMSLVLLALAAPLAAPADVVTDWDTIAATTITPPAGTVLAPAVTEAERRPTYSVDLATLHVAIYDAVTAIDKTHKPYAIRPTLPTAGASQQAAVVGAAYGVLKGLYPGRASLYQAAFDSYVAAAGSDAAKTPGLAIGAEVAAGTLAVRSNDGRWTAFDSYITTGAPADFVPSSPALVNQFGPYIRPFAIRSAAQFRAPPPNYTPRNWRRFANDSQSIATNARLLALLWVVNADTTIGCFESKYHYRFWRPRTAIPMADTDGNAQTTADPGCAPIVPTPNHPEYPAAHTCSEGSLAESLRQFYDTKNLSFMIDSGVVGLLNPVRHFTSTDQMVSEVTEARIFGGMHYRNSTREGARLGRRTAKWISEHHFQPVEDDRDHSDRCATIESQ